MTSKFSTINRCASHVHGQPVCGYICCYPLCLLDGCLTFPFNDFNYIRAAKQQQSVTLFTVSTNDY